MLSSSTISKAGRESRAGKLSNVAKIGVEGGTRGFVGLFNEEESEDGSFLMLFEVVTEMAREDLAGEWTDIPFIKQLFSNS